jgi:hypothetical protein
VPLAISLDHCVSNHRITEQGNSGYSKEFWLNIDSYKKTAIIFSKIKIGLNDESVTKY